MGLRNFGFDFFSSINVVWVLFDCGRLVYVALLLDNLDYGWHLLSKLEKNEILR